MNDGAEEIHGDADWIAADGRRIFISADVRRVVDGEGNLRYLICGQDLTELVAQRNEIEAQRDFLSAVSRATPSLLIAVERDGTIAPGGRQLLVPRAHGLRRRRKRSA